MSQKRWKAKFPDGTSTSFKIPLVGRFGQKRDFPLQPPLSCGQSASLFVLFFFNSGLSLILPILITIFEIRFSKIWLCKNTKAERSFHNQKMAASTSSLSKQKCLKVDILHKQPKMCFYTLAVSILQSCAPHQRLQREIFLYVCKLNLSICLLKLKSTALRCAHISLYTSIKRMQ